MLGILLGELLAEAEALRVRIGLGFGEEEGLLPLLRTKKADKCPLGVY